VNAAAIGLRRAHRRRDRGLSMVLLVQRASAWIPDQVITRLLMLPSVVLMALIFMLPLLVSLVLSLYSRADSSELVPSAFVGLDNYSDLVGDPDFVAVVLRTLVYTGAAVALEVVLGFLMALVLNVNLPVIRALRTILIVPMMMTPIVAALMWKLALDYDHGFMNRIVPLDIIWLGSPAAAFVAVVGVNVWQNAPYVALILLAGLRTLPADVFDAAVIDGATRIQRIRFVVIPLLLPYLLLSMLLRTIFEFRAFDNVFILTGGGPGTSTMVLSLFTYLTSFVSYDLGLSAAAAWLTLILTLALCGTLLLIVRRRL
jgi:multiple sugar transport system permease protein